MGIQYQCLAKLNEDVLGDINKAMQYFSACLVVMLCQENLEPFSYFSLRFLYDWRTKFGKVEQPLAASVQYELSQEYIYVLQKDVLFKTDKNRWCRLVQGFFYTPVSKKNLCNCDVKKIITGRSVVCVVNFILLFFGNWNCVYSTADCTVVL